jgi:hypothetical protein
VLEIPFCNLQFSICNLQSGIPNLPRELSDSTGACLGRYSILMLGLCTLFFDFPPTLVEHFNRR